MDRRYWSRKIEGLDPDRDYHRIYQILVAHEFPWDFNQSLSFALFRTFAVPSIGRLLYQTGEFTERTQKRYDDTGLILDGILEHGIKSTPGRAAVRRLNQMHGSYDISNDDMRYVLATFIVVPVRWLDDFGWRTLTAAERTANTNYYRELGRHMNIKDIPATYDEFASFMDTYERKKFRVRRRSAVGIRRHARPDGDIPPQPPRAEGTCSAIRHGPDGQPAAGGLPLPQPVAP